MNRFKLVNQNVTARQAAIYYGWPVRERGLSLCPFHDDHDPSMRLDERYYCFGCHATGDATDWVAQHFSLSKKDAAEKIIHDFCLNDSGITSDNRSYKREDAPRISDDPERFFLAFLKERLKLLEKWKAEYAPRSPDEAFDDRFVTAVKQIPEIQACLDEHRDKNAARRRREPAYGRK